MASCWRLLLLGSVPLVLATDSLNHLSTSTRLFPPTYEAWFDPWVAPGYALFLWLIAVPWGTDPLAILVGQMVVGLLSVVVYYKLGGTCAGRPVAVAAGLYVGLHSGFVVLEHYVLTETLALLLLGLTLLVAVHALDHPARRVGVRLAIVSGALMGATALVRPNLLVVVPVTVAVGVSWAGMRMWRDRHARPWPLFERPAAMALAGLAVMAPWLVSNAVAHGRVGMLTGVANIARLVFALEEDALPPDLPELVSLQPDLPVRCEQEPECGWHVVRAVRAQGRSEYEVDDWAGDLLSRYLRTHPADFARALVRVMVRQIGFDQQGRRLEIDHFVALADSPTRYAQAMAGYAATTPLAATLAQPQSFSSRRGPVIWTFTHIWRHRVAVVPVLFLLGLPWGLTSRRLALVTAVALALLASLALLLSTADRYILLIEPLMWLAGVAGALRWAGTFARAGRTIRRDWPRKPKLALAGGLILAVAVLTWAGPWVARWIDQRYVLETTATLAARRLPATFDPRRLMRLASQADDRCGSIVAREALRALGLTLPAFPGTGPSAPWNAGCPGLTTHNLLADAVAAPGGAGWIRHPDARATVVHRAGAEGAAATWEVSYQGGNWAVMAQEVLLEPDSLYRFEVALRSSGPVRALYWQAETGRFLEEATYAGWTPLSLVFITPHWDGAARRASFYPVLMLAPGQVWLREIRLTRLPVGSVRVALHRPVGPSASRR